MITLKNHIGILFILIIIMYYKHLTSKGSINTFKWYVPASAALFVFSILEALGWALYYFFVT